MSGLKQSLKDRLSEAWVNLTDRTFSKAMKELMDEGVVAWKINEFGVKTYYIKDEKKAEAWSK